MQGLAFSSLCHQWSITALPATEGTGVAETGGENEGTQHCSRDTAACLSFTTHQILYGEILADWSASSWELAVCINTETQGFLKTLVELWWRLASQGEGSPQIKNNPYYLSVFSKRRDLSLYRGGFKRHTEREVKQSRGEERRETWAPVTILWRWI